MILDFLHDFIVNQICEGGCFCLYEFFRNSLNRLYIRNGLLKCLRCGLRVGAGGLGMWTAWVVAAIALAGAAFMLRFLMALLREGPPSVCYWVVPERWGPQKEAQLKALHGIYFDDDCHTARDGGTCSGELLENENYAKEEISSGLIALDVRSIAGVDSRSIYARRAQIYREHRP